MMIDIDMRRASRVAAFLQDTKTRFVVLLLFLALVFLMGGGSRDDILSLVILRPLAILFLAYGLCLVAKEELRAVRAPLLLLLTLLLLISAQLVPLPPTVWENLPGRDLYAQIMETAGLGLQWQPLSLSPSKTLNSLFSLSVPLAALLLFAVQGRKYVRPTVVAIVLLGALSSFWGLLQLIGSSTGPLYLYRITNPGLPVGLFANRNHQAVVLAALIPCLAYVAFTAASRSRRGDLERFGMLFLALVFVTTVLMTGSRAGLLSLVIGCAGAAVIGLGRRADPQVNHKRRRLSRRPILVVALLALVVLAGVMAAWFGRALAIERLFATDHVEDARAQLTPILAHMAGFFFPAGSGFGSFEHVYDRFEPLYLLKEQYLNQAHNDWLQLLIEGGLPALAILLVSLLWLGRHAWLTWTMRNSADSGRRALRIASLFFILTLGFASLFDYPLRVPSVMAMLAIFCAVLARTGQAAKVGAPGPVHV